MTASSRPPLALHASAVAARRQRSSYPEPFASWMAQREKRALGEAFGLRNFGVNLTTLLPGGVSALLHTHDRQDEFVYVLEGTLVLEHEDGEVELAAGMCAGFPAGGRAHRLVNRGARPATYLEVGDRSPGDQVRYPADDLEAVLEHGRWRFRHKDGTPY